MTLVVAHRGASAAHPPGNTIEAFAAAVALGADSVELDVHLTADGVVVVHHDPDLADGRCLGELRRDELPAFVPTLADVLVTCGPLGVNVEIKADGPEHLRADLITAVVEQLAGAEGPERFLVTSFDHDVVARVRDLAPDLATGLLTMESDTLDAVLDRAVSEGHVAVVPWWGLADASYISSAHLRGVRVLVWTVDDPDVMATLVRAGVDGIITNLPELGRVVIDVG